MDKKLKKKGTWGGVESLKAVNQMYMFNILVINELGTCSFVNGFEKSFGRNLFLAFRNCLVGVGNVSNVHRNHYDSVVKIEKDVVGMMATHTSVEENIRGIFRNENNSDEIIKITDEKKGFVDNC